MNERFIPAKIPATALDLFGRKGYKLSWDYQDVWREEHARAFTVAKVAKKDLLFDIRRSVEQAIADGETLSSFKADLEPKLARHGWTGYQPGPDGKLIELGTPRRLRTIYDTNIRTARAAGQWDRIQKSKATNPYLIYTIGPSREHREEHVAWNGLVLSVDDQFWDTHYPPNGYGCRCGVRQLSTAEAEKKGIDQAPPLNPEPWTNTKTGRTEMIPYGLDPGWDTNAGKSALFDMQRDLADCIPGAELNAAAKNGCITALPGQSTWATLGLASIKAIQPRHLLPEPEKLARAKSYDDAYETTRRIFIGDAAIGVIDSPIESVIFTRDTIGHMVEKRLDARERFAHHIRATIENPWEIWATDYTDGTRNRYLAIFEGRQNLAVIVRINRDGSLFWNALNRDKLQKMDKLREGRLIYARE